MILKIIATTATALGIVTWLVIYLVLAVPMEQNAESVTLTRKLVSCLFPNMALHWAVKAMYSFETRGKTLKMNQQILSKILIL